MMMKGLFTLFLLLISIFCAAQQQELKSQIGKSKAEVKMFMVSNSSYELQSDTVLINIGEVLNYGIKTTNDSILLNNRILHLSFFFYKDKCDVLSFILYGSDALQTLLANFDKSYQRVGVNVWVDKNVRIGIRIIQLPPYQYGDATIEIYRIDMNQLDLIGN